MLLLSLVDRGAVGQIVF